MRSGFLVGRVERHGLVVIVALGESIVVLRAAAGLDRARRRGATLADAERPAAVVSVATMPIGTEIGAAAQVASLVGLVGAAIVTEQPRDGTPSRGRV